MGDFNPRFPWGKRRFFCAVLTCCLAFQSTLPVGEATSTKMTTFSQSKHFNPRFPWGKRPVASAYVAKSGIFQSTLPVGEATYSPVGYSADGRISIHASRGGSDPSRLPMWQSRAYFNPRFPWGKRPIRRLDTQPTEEFQSTLPVGEATRGLANAMGRMDISIHASRGGSDTVNFTPTAVM